MSELFYDGVKMDEVVSVLTPKRIPIMQMVFKHRNFKNKGEEKGRYWFRYILANGRIIRQHAPSEYRINILFKNFMKHWEDYWTTKTG